MRGDPLCYGIGCDPERSRVR